MNINIHTFTDICDIYDCMYIYLKIVENCKIMATIFGNLEWDNFGGIMSFTMRS